MRLFEHEAKELLRKAGIPVPQNHLCTTVAEVKAAAQEIGAPVVLKAQVLIGGRGKAGGIKFADDHEQAEAQAQELLSITVRGYSVDTILVEPKYQLDNELYLGVTIDRINYKIALIGSSQGGMAIEEIAVQYPDAIVKLLLSPSERFYPHMGVGFAQRMGLSGKVMLAVARVASKLVELFRSCDAKLLEINPLAVVGEEVMAVDARCSLDDDAIFRQPELAQLGLEDRHEEGEMTPRERQAREWQIPYLDMDGDIGMFPGGAGFGIMGNDFIHQYGGKAANFMDSGGGPKPERIAKMLVLLDDNPQVKAIFGARFGGVSRCDDFARGVIMFLREHGLSKPMVVRMTGNAWQDGVRLFEEARQETPDIFTRIEIHGIDTPIEEICQRAVEMAEEAV